ncbi:hypothetical protein ACFQS7_25160 [Dankookia sp. GCM10030260]|uniref:hypothetical protein n=1 Tax=Dankookia sp. GCM10030260 TaxID=3273390 RepID=UPI00360F0E79
MRRIPVLAVLGLLAGPVSAAPDQVFATPSGPFIDLAPPAGSGPVRLAVGQVVRIGRLEGETVIDTTAYVQQPTPEAMESLVRRLAATGARLVPLTDPSSQRTWIAADRVVLVRGSETRHAAGARAAIVLTGLRNTRDVAVRETVEEVMAALAR